MYVFIYSMVLFEDVKVSFDFVFTHFYFILLFYFNTNNMKFSN